VKTIARILAIPAVTCWLIRRSMCTPYLHIVKDGVTYMERYWLVNPYDSVTRKTKHTWFPLSLRIHHIMQPDQDRDLHDHPWNARTFILRGWYIEERENGHWAVRTRGETARLDFGEYHRITEVSDGGVWTLFVTSKFQGVWGFKVDGVKVPFWEYLAKKAE
jgi:hypothetical protein